MDPREIRTRWRCVITHGEVSEKWSRERAVRAAPLLREGQNWGVCELSIKADGVGFCHDWLPAYPPDYASPTFALRARIWSETPPRKPVNASASIEHFRHRL